MRTFTQKPKAAQQTIPAKSTIYSREKPGQGHDVHSILHPQRMISNQAMQQLLQPQTEELKANREFEAESTNTVKRIFAHDFSRIPVCARTPLPVQTKLTINRPGDIYEQEADRVADQVLATPAHHVVIGAPPRIQRFPGQSNGQRDATPASVDQALATPGRPLESALRQDMEQRFGHNFSQVRVHFGIAAEQSARDVNANAYTVGRDIVFGAGQFTPGSQGGRRLIAHELTHVVQQSQQRIDRVEGHQNDQAARAINVTAISHEPGGTSEPVLRREATRPRAATTSQSIADITKQTEKLPSGKVTAATLAAMEWESLFSRHFMEPDRVFDEVESKHSRYLYSRLYGWIDGQHFFAHVQFAEESGVEGATQRGIDIERKQASLRKLIGPDPNDPTIYSDFLQHNLITPDDFAHYREGTLIALSLAMDSVLTKKERDLVKGFDDTQRAKFILDNAYSAWSYEDLVSNQLGVQFFRLHGAYVNSGVDAAQVRERFIERIEQFFDDIDVVDNADEIKRLSRKLPGKERWTSPKMTESETRERFPELFRFDDATHQVVVGVYFSGIAAEKAKKDVAQAVPSVAAKLHIAPPQLYSSTLALYAGPMSAFEAVVLKSVIGKVASTSLKRPSIEPVPP